MRKEIEIDVSAGDRLRLEAIVADRNSAQKHVWRARIILATGAGCRTAEVMRRAGVSKPCVWRSQERFMTAGVDGLLRDKTRPARILPLPMANRTLAHVRRLFGWAMERGIVTASPVVGVGAPAREVSRDRVLDDAELAAVWQACEALGWPFCPIVRLLIVTGARRDEVASMRWRDLDLERTEWRLPREAVKADREHVIPLSAGGPGDHRGLGADRPQPARVPGEPCSSTNPVSGFSGAERRLDQLSGVEGWRYHDIRRTVATGLQRLGVRLEVTEAVLGHVSGSRSGIVGVYQRHEYRD